jgi:hypothetical protein
VVFDAPAAAAPAAFPATPASKQRAAAPAADANGSRAAAPATAESAMATDVGTAQDVDDTQARLEWLQRVRSLRDAGRLDDARERLHAFRERWPDYPLPEDLQPLAR